jgi:hypothetical protein
MTALTVFFEIIDTQDQIQDTGKIEASLFAGNISFKDVRLAYRRRGSD